MGADLLLVGGVGAIFVAVVLALSIAGVITNERQAVNRSLAAVQAMQAAPVSMKQELDRPFKDRVLAPAMNRFVRLGRRFTPSDKAARLRQKLDVAGNPAGWDVDRIGALKVIGALAGTAGVAMLCFALGVGLVVLVVVAALAGAAGFFAPNLVVNQMGHKRTIGIRNALADAIDLLTISVEAGLAFDAALSQVARNSDGPLAEEFSRVLQEMQIGMGRGAALRALGDRTSLPELKAFVNAMVQADAFGIPIANVLRIQSKEMRLKRRQYAEEKAQKVPVKILFPLIFFILPTLFIIILGPAVITIMDLFFGSGGL